jgi:hypothetical protein
MKLTKQEDRIMFNGPRMTGTATKVVTGMLVDGFLTEIARKCYPDVFQEFDEGFDKEELTRYLKLVGITLVIALIASETGHTVGGLVERGLNNISVKA